MIKANISQVTFLHSKFSEKKLTTSTAKVNNHNHRSRDGNLKTFKKGSVIKNNYKHRPTRPSSTAIAKNALWGARGSPNIDSTA